jgi:hypothetical protein
MPAMRPFVLIALLLLAGCAAPDGMNGRASPRGPDHVTIGFPF